MNELTVGIIALFTLALLAVPAVIVGRIQLAAYHARYEGREQEQARAWSLHPLYRQALAEDRQYELASRELRLKEFQAFTQIAIPQYGSLVPQDISASWVHVAPIHKPPAQIAGPAETSPDVHIPTFAEDLASGAISPRQRDMLFSYELLEDEDTGQVRISPIRGDIDSQHTQFIVAGSQSGKTTYMSGIIAQAVAMKTVLYVIDPHRSHPEKSLSSKLAAFQDWMILPPASTHQEIERLLAHATKTRDDLIAGKKLYQGYHIMVVVDEAPALMQYQRSQDKQLRQLYINLALFMQSIGTQTAKFGMTGLFSSQFATLEPLGEVNFRDACMSLLIMRLGAKEAQAMRILGKDRVNAIPKFQKGHGFLLLADSGDVLRVAAGNVAPYDLATFADMLPPSPLQRTLETSVKHPAQPGHFSSVPLEPETSLKQADETPLQADYETFRALKREGFNQGQIIWKLFHVQAGATKDYRDARDQYLAWNATYEAEEIESEAWRV